VSDLERHDRFIDSHLDASLAELSRLVAQPSVAAQGIGLEECAALVVRMFQARGFATEVVTTAGAPVVIAERRGRDAKTLLFYNHYDVQPAEPLELWDSPPFEAAQRDGKLYGRGVSDDKGHITARLLALDSLLAGGAELPCTIKFVIEGEEEVSSIHLGDTVRRYKDRLAADACVWEFGYVDHMEAPVLHAGLRGICYVELTVETASHDAHSGIGGSIFPNAAWRLTWALASLKGPDERIRIAGFYDDVRTPSHLDRELMAALPDAGDEYRSRYGLKGFLKGLTGGVELSIAEVFEPTCTICGLDSGYQGKGSKTVLPAKAKAKVDFRLVPDQTPARVLLQLRSHLDTHGFKDVHVQFLGGESPGRTDPDHPFLALVRRTADRVFDQPMRLVPMIGGSGPNHVFIHELGVPIATAGLGYPDTRAHAPNENIRIDLYAKHAKHMARLITEFARS